MDLASMRWSLHNLEKNFPKFIATYTTVYDSYTIIWDIAVVTNRPTETSIGITVAE